MDSALVGTQAEQEKGDIVIRAGGLCIIHAATYALAYCILLQRVTYFCLLEANARM